MLDEPELFVSTLHNFLSAANVQDAHSQIALDLQPKCTVEMLPLNIR
jgi:hypothetical protein